TSAKLIRATKRMADAFGAEWLAAAVAGEDPSSSAIRQQVAQHLRLAERLGAETHILVGKDIPTAILDYARSRNVTKIVVGKTFQPWWKRVLARTVAEIIVDASGDIDVYVITGEGEPTRPPAAIHPPAWIWSHYLATAFVVALCGLVSWAIHA